MIPDWPGLAKEHESNRERRRAGAMRNRAHRWRDGQPTTLVSADGHPPVEVPQSSKFGALLCACELWHCKFYDLENIKIGRELNSK